MQVIIYIYPLGLIVDGSQFSHDNVFSIECTQAPTQGSDGDDDGSDYDYDLMPGHQALRQIKLQ